MVRQSLQQHNDSHSAEESAQVFRQRLPARLWRGSAFGGQVFRFQEEPRAMGDEGRGLVRPGCG